MLLTSDDAIMVDMPSPLRRLQPIELASSSRHHMGLYLSVTITCRYNPPWPDQKLDEALVYPALKRVILSQPMLRVGILDEHTNRASFCSMKQINLAKHVTFSTTSCKTISQYNDHIASQQSWHHDQPWQDIEKQPPWRLAVIEPTGPVQEQLPGVQDIFFSYHHALLDGTSGRLFHEQLLTQLNNQLQHHDPSSTHASPSPLLDVPPIANLPAAQAQIPFKISPSFFLKTLWSEFAPVMLRPQKRTPWHGKSIDFSLPYKTNTKPLDIPQTTVSNLLQACRSHSTTITGILQALTLTSLATRLSAPEASSFTGATAIGLRPFLPARSNLKDTLAVLVTNYMHDFPPEKVSQLRDASSSPDTLTALIWHTAQVIKQDLTTRTRSLPRDDVSSLLKYIADWFDFYHKKDGKPRDESWEISNIGVFNDEHDGSDPRFTVSRVYFTNGAMVAGAPLGLGVGSVKGGALTIALSWQEGIVTAELMAGLAEDLSSYMACFEQTGMFTR